MVLVAEIDDLCNHHKEIHSVFVPKHKKEAPHACDGQLIVCMPGLKAFCKVRVNNNSQLTA